MKIGILKSMASVCMLAAAGCADATRLERGRTEIVLAPDAPKSTRFAADELRSFLTNAFCGVDVAIATNVRPGVAHIFVGASEWAACAGILADGLARDAFTIRADGRDVYIVGRDDPKVDTRHSIYSPHTGVWDQLHEHATLFGVYEFLESYAGVRMYFPGELGTIVPRSAAIIVPNGVRTITPDCLARDYSWWSDGIYFEGGDAERHLLPERKVQYQRNRMQTLYIPCSHGQCGFNLLRRFAKSNPEYFARNADGSRRTDPKIAFPGHLCHSSEVWDEMYKDILSYARGDGPDARGISTNGRWSIMAFRRPWVDVMPQDGFTPCQCADCRSAYRTNEIHYATELIWGRTVELARKLKSAAPDIRITQMAYTPYRRIPDFDIPDNVDVMVAEGGPWTVNDAASMSNQTAEIRGWAEKLGHPVWIWTYPNKFGKMAKATVSIPNPAPRSYVKYYRHVSPWIFGAFAENENDRWFYNYLSNYVFGKFCWNTNIDVEAILDEHFRLLFGPAARPMADFVREMEDLWVGKVAGRVVDGALGPVAQRPSEYDLFTSIYSPEVIAHWRRDFMGKARALVSAGSMEARRIDLYEREFIEPLAARAQSYIDSISVEKELSRRAGQHIENLLVNGYMDLPPQGSSKRHYGLYEKGAWKGGWIGDFKTVENVSFVKDAPPGLPASVRFTVSGKPDTVCLTDYLNYWKGPLKPATKYRFSVFVRMEDVKSGGGPHGGGVCFRIWDGKNTFYPDYRMTGTTGWFNHVVTFTTPADVGKHPHTLSLYLANATGSALFSGALLEAVGD